MNRATARALRLTGVLLVGLALAACDDDGPSAPPTLDLEVVEGFYDPITITFDPQGSAPAADVMAALEETGVLPELNIALTGTFQMPYRDPVSREFRTLDGTVTPTQDGVTLTFETQAFADQVLFPRVITFTYDEDEQTLTTSGSEQVSRSRLMELFPELYAEEQLFDPTPGTLTVGFVKTTT